MKVYVKGGTKTQKKYARSIIDFCANKLMSKRLANSLIIKLHFTPLYEKHKQMGNCIWEDDSYRPKEFFLEIDPGARLRRVLESICHEMVHVKQLKLAVWIQMPLILIHLLIQSVNVLQ